MTTALCCPNCGALDRQTQVRAARKNIRYFQCGACERYWQLLLGYPEMCAFLPSADAGVRWAPSGTSQLHPVRCHCGSANLWPLKRPSGDQLYPGCRSCGRKLVVTVDLSQSPSYRVA